jgi:hypothetical protein
VDYADSRVIAWGLLVVAALAVWLAFWPGLISPDSNQTIYQAASNQYTDWWTPFGAWLLHWWLHLALGLSGVYAVGVTVAVCGMYLCARFWFRRVPAAAVALVTCILPPVYADLSGLSRDLFFLGFTFLGFGLFGRLVQGRARSRAQEIWLAMAAVVSELLAFLSRQNGAACLFALLLGLVLWRRSRSAAATSPRPRRQVLTALVIAVVGTGAIGLTTTGVYSLIGVRHVDPQRFTYVYDLASMSVLSGHDRFPGRVVDQPHPGWVSPPNLHEANLDRLFDPTTAITLYPNNAAGAIDFPSSAIAARENSVLQSAWLKAIGEEPLDYAWGRIRLLAVQLGLWRHPTDAYLALLDPTNFGHPVVFPANYHFASRVLSHFVGPQASVPLDFPWTWLVLIIACLVFLARRLKRLAWHFLLLPLAVLVNYGLLFFTIPAAGFRYVVLEVPVGAQLAAYVIATLMLRSERWRRLLDPAFLRLAGG